MATGAAAVLLTISMGAAALGGGGLALFLLLRARGMPGAVPLAGFLLLVGLWAVGLLLPGRLGLALLALAPLAAAVFVHFAARLAGRCDCLLAWAYGIGGMASLAALANPSGRFEPWPGVGVLYRPEGAGLLAAAVTLALAGYGHLLLLGAWRDARGKRRRQLAAVLASSLLGLAAVSGLALPLLGLRVTPWPLFLLPVYVVVLAYGMLRHELMAANQWARRALAWGLAMAAAVLAVAAVAWLAAAASALIAALAAGLTLLLGGPLQRLADRLVFPGGQVSAAELAAWRDVLAEADSEAAIAAAADALLRRRLRLPDGPPDLSEAPPGARRVAELVSQLAAEARTELVRRRAQAESRRLAELGALAATVAHDLRNPMNILHMAVADADPELRREVKTQLARMEALVWDLLDYAKPWPLAPRELSLGDAVAQAARGRDIASDISPDLMVRADPLRLEQALVNLLANAQAAGGRVLVSAEAEAAADGAGVVIRVCDDGPGIPEDIRDSLFQPFVSRGAPGIGSGGTGLGLAIVAKVMVAHGGSVALEPRPGWSTCFTLRFPP